MHEMSARVFGLIGRATCVLLFNGNDREMRAYMAKMGIET